MKRAISPMLCSHLQQSIWEFLETRIPCCAQIHGSPDAMGTTELGRNDLFWERYQHISYHVVTVLQGYYSGCGLDCYSGPHFGFHHFRKANFRQLPILLLMVEILHDPTFATHPRVLVYKVMQEVYHQQDHVDQFPLQERSIHKDIMAP